MLWLWYLQPRLVKICLLFSYPSLNSNELVTQSGCDIYLLLRGYVPLVIVRHVQNKMDGLATPGVLDGQAAHGVADGQAADGQAAHGVAEFYCDL